MLGVPELAGAQAGWYVYPSLSLGESYDDNVTSTSANKQGDFITNTTVGLAAGYSSAPFSLLANYAFTAQLYAEHSELNNVGYQNGGLSLQYRPDLRWDLGLNVSYQRTPDSGDFLFPASARPATVPPATVGTGGAPPTSGTGPTPAGSPTAPTSPASVPPAVDVGRQTTSVFSAGANARYNLTPITIVGASYNYTRSDIEDGEVTNEHAAGLTIRREITSRDSMTLDYTFSVFDTTNGDVTNGDVTDGGADSTGQSTVNTIELGWARQLAPGADFSVAAGPSFTDGDVRAAVDLRLNYEWRVSGTPVNTSISYERSQGLVVGIAGASNIDQVVVSAGFAPARLWYVGVDANFGNYSAVTSGAQSFRVYTLNVAVSRTITQWMAVAARYSFTYQDTEGEILTRNVFLLSLDFSYPFRVY
jgi:hypothetical protein